MEREDRDLDGEADQKEEEHRVLEPGPEEGLVETLDLGFSQLEHAPRFGHGLGLLRRRLEVHRQLAAELPLLTVLVLAVLALAVLALALFVFAAFVLALFF